MRFYSEAARENGGHFHFMGGRRRRRNNMSLPRIFPLLRPPPTMTASDLHHWLTLHEVAAVSAVVRPTATVC